jgi:hypothetical protein
MTIDMVSKAINFPLTDLGVSSVIRVAPKGPKKPTNRAIRILKMINVRILGEKIETKESKAMKKLEYKHGFRLPYRSENCPDRTEPIRKEMKIRLAWRLFTKSLTFH